MQDYARICEVPFVTSPLDNCQNYVVSIVILKYRPGRIKFRSFYCVWQFIKMVRVATQFSEYFWSRNET